MWSAHRPPKRVSGPVPRTNDIDTDERGQTIPQRGRPPTTAVDKRCLMSNPCRSRSPGYALGRGMDGATRDGLAVAAEAGPV